MPPSKDAFVERLLEWFRTNGRDYPWRRTTDPYKVFAAEFMLQRTTPGHVLPVYEDFINRYPNPDTAAAADDLEFNSVLKPLGLGKRAVLLKKALRELSENYGGKIPDDPDHLMHLPGVGLYTARAVSCFVYKRDFALVDVNVLRVLQRVFRLTSGRKRAHTDKALWRTVDAMIPPGRGRDFNLALIDLAALVCRKRTPRCRVCPVGDMCRWEGGSTAVGRGEIRRFRFIDLFSGAGGLSLGFRDAGFVSVFAVECDPAAAQTYRDNFGNHVYEGRIEDLNVETIPPAEVVVGGPPCQGFSPLGKMSTGDRRRSEHNDLNGLLYQFMRVVEGVRPLAFVMENVPEMLKSAEGAEVVRRAEELGFSVAHGVLNAADYGVPQARKRAFIVGVRGARAELPERTGERVTVRDAIGHLPLEPDGVNWHIGRNPTPKSLERYKCVPPGGNRFDLIRRRPDLAPSCWLKKKTGTTDVFGRLRWDGLASTIRTEFFKPEKGRYLHPEVDRPITHREAACLQSFPDDFVFYGSKIEVARQIGNAVPPKLAFAVARKLREILERITGYRDDAGAEPVATMPSQVCTLFSPTTPWRGWWREQRYNGL